MWGFGVVPAERVAACLGAVPGGKAPGTGEGAETGAEVGSGGVRSADILRGRLLSDRPAPQGDKSRRHRRWDLGSLPGSVAAGRRAPPGGAPRHCPPSLQFLLSLIA